MDLEKQEQNQERGIVSDLIIGGMAAGIIISLLVKYKKKIKILPNPTIPPIIIKPKSKQLEIVYGLEMKETKNTQTKVYEISDFDWVQNIGVHYFNPDSKNHFHDPYPSRRGVKVEIYLQRKPTNSGGWDWVEDDDHSQITILGNQENFQLIVKTPGHYLSEEDNNYDGDQRFKRSYVGEVGFDYRMGKMAILVYNDVVKPTRPYISKPLNQDSFNDQYSLALHHKSSVKSRY